MTFTLKVNGKTKQVTAAEGTPLLWVIRDELGLTGTKFGCGVASCGACTVHLDGEPVNPDVIIAQMESEIGYGTGHIMRAEITFTDGEVDQYNFPDYEPLLIGDIGQIDVHMVPSAEAPSGVGEPGTPPAGPALANALAVYGQRVTMLPMTANGVDFG